MDSGIGMLALQVLQIVWIDLLLSGDNAVVIAMACRSLPEEQRRWGIILGAGAAVLLRIVFAAVIVQLLALPYVHIIGGVLLLWIAVQLALDEHAKHKVKSPRHCWAPSRRSSLPTVSCRSTTLSRSQARRAGRWN